MRSTNSLTLYRQLLMHIARMHNDVDYRRTINAYMNNVPGRIRKQYPAVSVGAECNGFGHVGNQHITAQESDFDNIILYALIANYGQLNNYDPISGNYVGHCAENYAATKVIEELRNTNIFPIRLSDIGFTDAIQPRTWKMVDWCSICHTIFD